MSKPKEYFLVWVDRCIYGEFLSREHRIFENPDADMLDNSGVHVIEKSAADRLAEALAGILEIGKRDTTNPKYDGYFEIAHEALAEYKGKQP